MPILSVEERNDLRKHVLMGQPLTLEEARSVIESCRTRAGAAMLAVGEKKQRKSKQTLSDEAFDADLTRLGL